MNRIYGQSSHLPVFKEGDDEEDNESPITDDFKSAFSRQKTFTKLDSISNIENKSVLQKLQISKYKSTGSLLSFEHILTFFTFN